jgi:hypothetical protein
MKKLSLSLPLLYASVAFAQSPLLLVRLYNKPNVPAPILLNAEKEAAALFESCSIKVKWEDCSKTGVCDQDLAQNELILWLRPPSRDARRAGDRSAVLGSAEIGANGTGVSGRVNYDVIQIVAARGNISVQMLLAYVFAHEIAHLLGAVHEPAGVMHDCWGPVELQRLERVYLNFDKKQRDHIRAEVQTRIQPHKASK